MILSEPERPLKRPDCMGEAKSIQSFDDGIEIAKEMYLLSVVQTAMPGPYCQIHLGVIESIAPITQIK